MQETIELENRVIKLSYIEGVNMQSLHDYMVMAYNNDVTDGQAVVNVLMKHCDYTEEQAISYTVKVHRNGKAVVFWGTKSGCEGLVKALGQVFVTSEVLKNE